MATNSCRTGYFDWVYIYLGLGFEFEFRLQRNRDLAFLCPWSVAVREVVAFPIVEKQQCAKQIAEKELEQNKLGDIC